MNVFEALERGRKESVAAAAAARDGSGDGGVGGRVPPVSASVDALKVIVGQERMVAAQKVVKTYLMYEAISESRARAEARAAQEEKASYTRVTAVQLARDELAAALDKPVRGAGFLIDFAVFVVERAPAVLEAMYDGLLDESRARSICARLGSVTDAETCRELAEKIVAGYRGEVEEGRRFGETGLGVFVDDIIADTDSDAVEQRREAAKARRSVSVSGAGDGMARLRAVLPVEQAAILRERLRVMARSAAEAAGARVTSAMEADALAALATGCAGTCRHTGAGGDSGPAFQVVEQVVLRPQITVVTGYSGATEVYVRHLGRTSLDTLAAILGQSVGSTFHVTGIDRLDSSPEAARSYRIPADLARRVRLRDGTCRHPGCSVPAEQCDIDHIVPFDRDLPELGGLTTEDNLVCMCRSHHRLKTHGQRSYQMSPDGQVVYGTDYGQTVRSEPSGPLARARTLRRGRPSEPVPTQCDPPLHPPKDNCPDSIEEMLDELRVRYDYSSRSGRRAAKAAEQRERLRPRPKFLYEGDVEIIRKTPRHTGSSGSGGDGGGGDDPADGHDAESRK